MIAEATEPTSSGWTVFLPAIVTGVLGIAGVVLGGALAAASQAKVRRNARNEKLIAVYADWQASLNALVECDHQTLLTMRVLLDPTIPREHKQDFEQKLRHISRVDHVQAKKREEDAFALIQFFDCESEEARLADRVRKIDPLKTTGLLQERRREECTATSENLRQLEEKRARFLELSEEQAKQMWHLARAVAARCRVV